MYKLTNQIVNKKVTPEECEKFLGFNNFPGQRKLHEPKARRYSELLTSGALRPVEIAFATLPDGNRYLMNGQHVCQGCKWSGRDMLAMLTYYKCETWRDAWELFATFDVHAARTQGQVFNAARGMFSNKDLQEVSLRLLQNFGTALAVLQTSPPQFNLSTATADKTTKVRLVEKHANEVLWLSSIPEYDILNRVGVLTAAVATYRKDKTTADTFWRSVVEGTGYKSKTDPAKKVRDFILDGAKIAGGGHHRKNMEGVYCVCVAWWNSYRTGESRWSVKLGAMKELPEVA